MSEPKKGFDVRELVDATEAKTPGELDRLVCYPIPPPDSQPVVVTWGLLRKLTDLPEEVEHLKTQLGRCTPYRCRVSEDNLRLTKEDALKLMPSAYINGKFRPVTGSRVSYRDVVEAAGMTGHPSVVYTRVNGVWGVMYEGCEDLELEANLIFDVAHTGNA